LNAATSVSLPYSFHAPPTEFQIADAVHSRVSDGALVSSEKIRVNAIAALEWLNRSRSNRF
jgi:hypothetical protein